jgi:hypothetical protein
MLFPVTRNPFLIGFCYASGSVYYAAQGGRIIKITSGSIKIISAPTYRGEPIIELCARSKLIINQRHDAAISSLHIFDTISEDFLQIRNFNGIVKSRSQNDGEDLVGALEGDNGTLFSFGFLPPSQTSAWAESRLLRINPIPSIAPQLMLLLNEEPSD